MGVYMLPSCRYCTRNWRCLHPAKIAKRSWFLKLLGMSVLCSMCGRLDVCEIGDRVPPPSKPYELMKREVTRRMGKAIEVCRQHYRTTGCGKCPIRTVCGRRIAAGRGAYNKWIADLEKAAKAVD